MKKDFDKWNKKKKQINNQQGVPFWCSLGINVGFEQDGSGDEYDRPVLILKVMSAQTCFAIPLTTSSNKHSLRPSVGIIEGKEARAILSQMRLIDSKRLIRKVGYLDGEIFKQIRKAAKEML